MALLAHRIQGAVTGAINPLPRAAAPACAYSHSIVPGGLLVMS